MALDFNKNLPLGATPLDPNESQGLKFKHVTLLSELNELENRNIAKAMLWVKRNRKAEPLTVTFLLRLHKQMFVDVWKWAGIFRISDKNIGVPWPEVPTKVKILLDDTGFWIQNEVFSLDEIGVRLYHRLVAIHPFANGNGSHARLLCDVLLEKNNVEPFTWGKMTTLPSEARKKYIQALQAADHDNYDLLTTFVRS